MKSQRATYSTNTIQIAISGYSSFWTNSYLVHTDTLISYNPIDPTKQLADPLSISTIPPPTPSSCSCCQSALPHLAIHLAPFSQSTRLIVGWPNGSIDMGKIITDINGWHPLWRESYWGTVIQLSLGIPNHGCFLMPLHWVDDNPPIWSPSFDTPWRTRCHIPS